MSKIFCSVWLVAWCFGMEPNVSWAWFFLALGIWIAVGVSDKSGGWK